MANRNTKKTPTEPLPETPAAPLPQPVHYWSVEQWKKNPVAQQHLQKLLDDPMMRMAFQTLLQMTMPKSMPGKELVPGVSAEALMLQDNNKFHHRCGMTAMYRLLHGLARPAGDKDTKRQLPWGELQPEDE
jgi:hypothetical protein